MHRKLPRGRLYRPTDMRDELSLVNTKVVIDWLTVQRTSLIAADHAKMTECQSPRDDCFYSHYCAAARNEG